LDAETSLGHGSTKAISVRIVQCTVTEYIAFLQWDSLVPLPNQYQAQRKHAERADHAAAKSTHTANALAFIRGGWRYSRIDLEHFTLK